MNVLNVDGPFFSNQPPVLTASTSRRPVVVRWPFKADDLIVRFGSHDDYRDRRTIACGLTKYPCSSTKIPTQSFSVKRGFGINCGLC